MQTSTAPWTGILGLPPVAIDGVDAYTAARIADDVAVIALDGRVAFDMEAEMIGEEIWTQRAQAAGLPTGGRHVDQSSHDALLTIMSTAAEDVLDLSIQAAGAHAAIAATWTGETDVERLDRALAALEAADIAIFPDAGCGYADPARQVETEVEEQEICGNPVRGTVLYDRGDLNRAVRGEGLRLTCHGGGSVHYMHVAEAETDHDPAADRAIVDETLGILAVQGLAAERIDGTDDQILVRMDWRRRPDTVDATGTRRPGQA